MKPVIGIVSGIMREGAFLTERVYANRDYIDAIERTGGAPVLLPVIKEPAIMDQFVAMCDGFLFTGGVDVKPNQYGEEPLPLLGVVNGDMDDFQIPLCKKVLASNKAILAICRGTQVMNVSCGGSLFQDVSYAGTNILKHMQQTDIGEASQTATIKPQSKLHAMWGDTVAINSYHHQSIKGVGKGLTIVATAHDGIIEAIEAEDHSFAIGVQWHPEIMFSKEDSMRILFEEFVNAAKENK